MYSAAAAGSQCRITAHMDRSMNESVKKTRQQPQAPSPDPLRHFSREGPGWKLAALVVCKLAPILIGFTALLYALKAIGLFS